MPRRHEALESAGYASRVRAFVVKLFLEIQMIQLAENPHRILLIKPSAIGDVVHALPVLNLLRRRWPNAKISWLVTPACAGLLDGHPQLDDVILFDRKRFGHAWRNPAALIALWRFS